MVEYTFKHTARLLIFTAICLFGFGTASADSKAYLYKIVTEVESIYRNGKYIPVKGDAYNPPILPISIYIYPEKAIAIGLDDDNYDEKLAKEEFWYEFDKSSTLVDCNRLSTKSGNCTKELIYQYYIDEAGDECLLFTLGIYPNSGLGASFLISLKTDLESVIIGQGKLKQKELNIISKEPYTDNSYNTTLIKNIMSETFNVFGGNKNSVRHSNVGIMQLVNHPIGVPSLSINSSINNAYTAATTKGWNKTAKGHRHIYVNCDFEQENNYLHRYGYYGYRWNGLEPLAYAKWDDNGKMCKYFYTFDLRNFSLKTARTFLNEMIAEIRKSGLKIEPNPNFEKDAYIITLRNGWMLYARIADERRYDRRDISLWIFRPDN